MTDRTITQNAALHLWFTQVADELNDAGFSVKQTLKANWDSRWTKELVKEIIWKGFLAKHNKSSTTEMTTKEVQEIYDDINVKLAEEFGFSIPFPTRFGQYNDNI